MPESPPKQLKKLQNINLLSTGIGIYTHQTLPQNSNYMNKGLPLKGSDAFNQFELKTLEN